MRIGVIILQDKKILLMHRFKKGREFFSLPGGGVEENESVEETATREAKEETSLDIILGEKFFEYYNDFDKRKNIVFLTKEFLGEVKLGGPEVDRISKENKYMLEWHDLSELKKLNIVPEILKDKLVEKYGV
ncbi:MAG: DNA mismatch repair protein MutT [Candidatus Magasanikbacteria bacterium CG_4_10_14_0_2_um_filter_33_14]|uniref:DNA mismatch repair protein MutT n=1 Tax=Candidatus Magasanikbacteria bacterium CG_4_10_14_0_2_um_filter_33_14 TaxID=1974636 RepID=A0A2M7VA44_9BACT|nr:MAG: DNA mismatch repair protein MutT [Candidatus Magasanikbacteria bacterium CG_4_10_14_0_2_um_filter_33_14]